MTAGTPQDVKAPMDTGSDTFLTFHFLKHSNCEPYRGAKAAMNAQGEIGAQIKYAEAIELWGSYSAKEGEKNQRLPFFATESQINGLIALYRADNLPTPTLDGALASVRHAKKHGLRL